MWGHVGTTQLPDPLSRNLRVWFLLANYHGERRASCLDLRRLSILCMTDSHAGIRPANHPHHLALCSMGDGLGWAPQEGAQELHPLARRGSQVHQVDRGKANHKAQVIGDRIILA